MGQGIKCFTTSFYCFYIVWGKVTLSMCELLTFFSLRRKHLFGSIDAKNLIGIEQFDIELFAAHLDDWRVRVCEIGN